MASSFTVRNPAIPPHDETDGEGFGSASAESAAAWKDTRLGIVAHGAQDSSSRPVGVEADHSPKAEAGIKPGPHLNFSSACRTLRAVAPPPEAEGQGQCAPPTAAPLVLLNTFSPVTSEYRFAPVLAFFGALA